MANKKVSELTAAGDVDEANDYLPLLDDSATELKKVTPALLLALYAKLASPAFTGTVTLPTAKITTGAVVDYIWKCTNADGSGGWAAESSPSSTQVLPTNYIQGLGMSHAADTEHDITVATGKARDATDAADIVLASAITKAFDQAWAVGTGQGGMASGESLPTSGTIHIWLIKRSDTGVVDVMANNNATSGLTPTLPAGYDYKRRIGSYRTNSSANILNGDWWGTSNNRTFMYDSPVLDSSAVLDDLAHTITLSVPGGFIVKAIVNTRVWGGVYLSSLNSIDMDPSTSGAPLLSAEGGSQGIVFTNTSSQIRARSVGTTNYNIATIGWEDSL